MTTQNKAIVGSGKRVVFVQPVTRGPNKSAVGETGVVISKSRYSQKVAYHRYGVVKDNGVKVMVTDREIRVQGFENAQGGDIARAAIRSSGYLISGRWPNL